MGLYCPRCGSEMEVSEELGKWEWIERCSKCSREWVVCMDNQDLTVSIEEV